MNVLLRPFTLTGRMILAAIEDAGHAAALWGLAMLWSIPVGITRLRAIAGQLYICGAQSLVVTLIVGVFTGMIMALQTGIVLQQYRLESFIGQVVLITLLKELGPFMCAFILAGRVGSGMAAELGTMKVSEEIDALRVMSIDPVKFLVVPRFIALSLVMPIMTIYCDIIGVIGGGVVAHHQIGVSYHQYYAKIQDYLQGSDLTFLYSGLFKAWVFGMVISIIGCSLGLRTTHGAEGVGKASRKSVVQSFLLILILNYFMSTMINRYF